MSRFLPSSPLPSPTPGLPPEVRLPCGRSFLSLALLTAAGLLLPVASAAQLRPAAPLQEAYFAWDEGRYVEAMEGYLAVLRGPEGEAHREEAALLTGELHPVRELDDDGRFLRISPDGRWVSWARNIGGAWETRVEPAGGGPRITVPAQQAAMSSVRSGAGSGDGAGVGAYLAWGEGSGESATLVVRGLGEGGVDPVRVPLPGVRIQSLAFVPDAPVLIVAAAPDPGSDRVILHTARAPEWVPEPVPLRDDLPVLTNPVPAAGGRVVLATLPPRSPYAASGAEATPTGGPALALVDLETGATLRLRGTQPSLSRDGSRLAFYQAPAGGERDGRILTLDLDAGVPEGEEALGQALRAVVSTELRLGDPALSPSGDRVAFKAMPHTDWEIFLVDAEAPEPLDPGTAANPPEGVRRVTREIQHDQFPEWIDDRHLLALKGEARHRRAYLYDLEASDFPGGVRAYRLFHNNTLRTIAPEYEWVVSPDGSALLISAERDGNTISPERGVFQVNLTRQVSLEDLVARLAANLEHEKALLAEGAARFAPLHDEVAAVAASVQVGRVHHYADALYRMGSKFIGFEGNLEATEYLAETLRGWGYEVEYEWFEPRGIRAANVIARLPGTANPELVYTISSHFDSVLPAPGADDNTSGTTALLEAARVLADHPRRATIEFAFLTAEEVGLLGAREYVRRAVEGGKRIVGVLNNDMIGWTRSHRLDNTIRYSNPGIMRIQHAAAHRYSDLITYDALYYRGTDGAVFFQAYGDIVGGIGSYPVLGNPNYHQRTDQVETINHRLVAEVSRTTVASIMLLADAPSRLVDLEIEGRSPNGITVSWRPAPEAGVTGYRVRAVARSGAIRELGVTEEPRFLVTGVGPGTRIEVRALGAGGLEGWDWAGVEIP